jgi:ribosome-associated protein
MTEDIIITKKIIIPSSEIQFRYSRSSGPGGQNVNKLSTKAELMFHLTASKAIDEPTKARLRQKLSGHLDSTGTVTITSQESRSQYQNRQIAVEKFILLLRKALIVPKLRKNTKPTRSATEKRLESKTKRGVVKKSRIKKIDLD